MADIGMDITKQNNNLYRNLIVYLRTRNLRIWETESKEVEAMRELGLKQSDSRFFLELAKTRDDEVIANIDDCIAIPRGCFAS